MLSRLVITFFPRSKCLLISWLRSPSAVILESPKSKLWHCFHCFPYKLWVCSFYQIWKIFVCYFFKYFSEPMFLWGLPVTYILGYWVCPATHRCSILFFHFLVFFLFVSFWIMCVLSYLIFSSIMANLMLIPSSLFFTSNILIVIPRSLIRI